MIRLFYRQLKSDSSRTSKSTRAHKGSFSDASLVWDHHGEGVVQDVAKTAKGALVTVKSVSPMQIGDKLSSRYADKGVIGAIISDSEMPHDQQGRPFEVLVNPHGTISRINPAQQVEARLGKLAEGTGQPQILEDFPADGRDITEWAIKKLEENGLEDTETVVDPATGRHIPEVFTGNRFFMKLHHQAEHKTQGRGLGAYTAEEQPARGGMEGAKSKRLAVMESGALMSHGALCSVLRDGKLIRGQSNQEYWSDIMAGNRPATPQVPLVYHQKFINQLKGAGINVMRQGTKLHLIAMTDKDVDDLAGDRNLQNTETVDWRERPQTSCLAAYLTLI